MLRETDEGRRIDWIDIDAPATVHSVLHGSKHGTHHVLLVHDDWFALCAPTTVIYDAATGEPRFTLPPRTDGPARHARHRLDAAQLSEDGRFFVMADPYGNIWYVHPRTGEEIHVALPEAGEVEAFEDVEADRCVVRQASGQAWSVTFHTAAPKVRANRRARKRKAAVEVQSQAHVPPGTNPKDVVSRNNREYYAPEQTTVVAYRRTM